MPKTTDMMPGYDRTFAQAWAEAHSMLRNDVRLQLRAILDAVQGLDSDAVLARINEVAAAEAARDAALVDLVGSLKELVEAHSSGQLDAEAVVRKMGELLTASDA